MGATNIEFEEIAKDLSIPNFYCFCKIEINQCPTEHIPLNIIVNLNDSDNNVNGDWCLCFINDDPKVYYSSFGDAIPNKVKDFMIKIDYRK